MHASDDYPTNFLPNFLIVSSETGEKDGSNLAEVLEKSVATFVLHRFNYLKTKKKQIYQEKSEKQCEGRKLQFSAAGQSAFVQSVLHLRDQL